MPRVPILLALALCACSRDEARLRVEPEPRGGASARAAEPPGKYGPAKLKAQTCPAPGSSLPPGVDSGCEACGPGEFCKVHHVRGRRVGTCERSTCEKDADCSGGICACGPPNECVPGNCRSESDCGGRECAPNRGRYGHGLGTYCRTDRDECRTHEACGRGEECVFAGDRWACRSEVPPPPPG